MVFINRIRMTLAERVALEQAIAQETRNTANIEYLAMMSDIDLDDETMEGSDAQEDE